MASDFERVQPQQALTLVADAAALLHANGSSTSSTLVTVERLRRRLNLSAEVLLTWDQVQVTDRHGAPLLMRAARPVSVQMRRVSALMSAVEGAETASALREQLDRAAGSPGSPTWLFALAAGTGATSLAIIFGSTHIASWGLIFVAAGIGGLLRRWLARRFGVVTQVFAAALIGGLAGGLSIHLGLTSTARLVAVCPAMVLVPGPQILNGCLDLAQHRASLAVARLSDAALTVLGICAGLLFGLLVTGGSLPVSATTVPVGWWIDMLAAGVVAACYSIYFSMPYHLIGWSVLAGTLGHGVHWVTGSMWGWHTALAAFATCLVVSLIITPLSRRHYVPFTSAGFAAVVALVPGVYLFRCAAGMIDLATGADQSVLLGTVQDGATAFLIIAAMGIGLLVSPLVSGVPDTGP